MADGDPTAVAELYERHASAVYSHAAHLLADVADGEDAVEETFRRAWTRAADYDQLAPDVATWLLLICRQWVAERLRVRRRVSESVLDDTTGLGAGEEAGAPADRARIAAALAAIPADQRAVLELAFFRGLPPAEVANMSRQSPETARTRLRVAARKLRESLTEGGPAAGAAPRGDRGERA